MSFYEFRPYVSVAERRRKAERELARLKKKDASVAPVVVEGRTITTTFWGNAWCTNLERYSDYANRLPRGRSYVRNGCVVDLKIAKGEVTAKVCGSDLYKIKIAIKPVAAKQWGAVCRDCAGAIDSVVELLQGHLSKSVMDRVCRKGDGLFPSPQEIGLSCSCPDWADMCKHVAAVLFGVGARLDREPRLLFVLRGVDENDLLARSGGDLGSRKPAPGAAKVLASDDMAALFGLDMVESPKADAPTAAQPTRPVPKARHRTASTASAAAEADAATPATPPRTKAPPRKRATAKVARQARRRR